jgi:hypothetical protein
MKKTFLAFSILILSLNLGLIYANETSMNLFAYEKQCSLNDGDTYLFKTFDFLEKTIAIANSINDIESREAVSGFLRFYKARLRQDYIDKDYQRFKEEAEFLYENLGEAIADIDPTIKEKIYECIGQMIKNLDL